MSSDMRSDRQWQYHAFRIELICILHCIFALAFSACEVLPSIAVGDTIQIRAVIVIVIADPTEWTLNTEFITHLWLDSRIAE